MKQIIFIFLVFFSLSSFGYKDEMAKTCRYRIYDANTGQTLGYMEFLVLSDNFDCGGQNALDAVLSIWQMQNP